MGTTTEINSALLRRMTNSLTKELEICQDKLVGIKAKLESLNGQIQAEEEDWYNSPLEDEIDTCQRRIEDFDEFMNKFYDLRQKICGSEGLPNAK